MKKRKTYLSVHQLHPLTFPISNLNQCRRERHTFPKPPLRTRLQVPAKICLRPDQCPRSGRLAHTNTSRDTHGRCLCTTAYDLSFPLTVRAANDGLFTGGSLERFCG